VPAGAVDSSKLALLRALPTRAVAAILPSGYPSSVAPSYLSYSLWSALATVFASSAGVLSTQSLLFALGVGAGVAIPASAAWTWICKDGLGQLGGVIYAAALGDQFDADPKRWRLMSAVAGDAAGALEIGLSLAPALLPFLPVAALANVGRNIAWLSASATKAGLHQALATNGNLADVTAKAGSQVTAAATLGTAVGVTLSAALGGDPTALACLFATLSAAHVSCVTLSLRAVALPTLSDARLRLACGPTFVSLPAPEASRSVAAFATPADVRKLERFLPLQGGADALSASYSSRVTISVGSLMDDIRDFAAFAAASGFLNAEQHEGAARSRYVVTLGHLPSTSNGGGSSSPPQVQAHLLLGHNADWADTLTGWLHAYRAASELQVAAMAGEGLSCAAAGDALGACTRNSMCVSCRTRVVKETREWVAVVGPCFLSGLERSGWWVGSPLLERGQQKASRRLEIM
jgi:hypothetical protein